METKRPAFAFELHILRSLFNFLSFIIMLTFMLALFMLALCAVVVCEIVGCLQIFLDPSGIRKTRKRHIYSHILRL